MRGFWEKSQDSISQGLSNRILVSLISIANASILPFSLPISIVRQMG
jgi:hypothetical protein